MDIHLSVFSLGTKFISHSYRNVTATSSLAWRDNDDNKEKGNNGILRLIDSIMTLLIITKMINTNNMFALSFAWYDYDDTDDDDDDDDVDNDDDCILFIWK